MTVLAMSHDELSRYNPLMGQPFPRAPELPPQTRSHGPSNTPERTLKIARGLYGPPAGLT